MDISAGRVADVVDAQKRFLELSGVAAEKQRAEAAKQAAADPQAEPVLSADELAANIDDQIGQYTGAGADSLSTTGAAQVLTSLISDEVYRRALRSAGGSVTGEQRAAARKEVEQQITQTGVKLDDAPDVLVDRAVEQTAIQAAIEATAPDDVRNQPVLDDAQYTAQLQDLYDAQVSDLTQLCVNMIVTSDDAAGQAARQRVEAGEAFAAVAAELSSQGRDAAVDGAGGCVAVADVAGVLGDEAKGAEAGDLLGPGEGADGSFIFVEVDRVNVPTFDDVRAQLEQANPNTSVEEAAAAVQQYVDEAFAGAVAAADVTIDPRYGTWDRGAKATADKEARRAQVVPPDDPGAATTTSVTTSVGATEAPTAPAGEPVPAGP